MWGGYSFQILIYLSVSFLVSLLSQTRTFSYYPSCSAARRCLSLSVSAALQLVHWKEPKKSAAAFGLSLLVLVSVATLSVISVVSYLLLAFLSVTITFRWAELQDRRVSDRK